MLNKKLINNFHIGIYNIKIIIMTIIDHKSLFPLDGYDILLFISIFFVMVLATISGIGGGGILIPLYMLIGGFDILNATALTVLTIACNSFVRMIFLINKKHPLSVKRYLIDYTPILLIVPFDGNTSFIGLIISTIVPKWFITCSILIVLGFVLYKTCKKAFSQYREEKTQEFKDHVLFCIDGISLYINKKKYDEIVNDEQEGDTNKMRIKYIVLLLLSFFLITAFTVIKNIFDPCSTIHYIIYLTQFIIVLLWGIFMICYIVKDYNKKTLNNHQLFRNDIKWEYKTTIKYAIVSSFTGLLSTYLGIGGGMILAPFMLHIGMAPEVVAGTSSVTTFFSSTITTLQYLAAGRIKTDYGLAIALLSIIYTFIAMKITKLIMQKYRKRSFITITLSLLIGTSIILLIINGLIDIKLDNFNLNFCENL